MKTMPEQFYAIVNFKIAYLSLLKSLDDDSTCLNDHNDSLELYSQCFKGSFDEIPIVELCDTLLSHLSNDYFNDNNI